MLEARKTVKDFLKQIEKDIDKNVIEVQKFLDEHSKDTFFVEPYIDESYYAILIGLKKDADESIYDTGFPYICIEFFPKYRIRKENMPWELDIDFMKRHPHALKSTKDLEGVELIEAAYDFLNTEFIKGEE